MRLALTFCVCLYRFYGIQIIVSTMTNFILTTFVKKYISSRPGQIIKTVICDCVCVTVYLGGQ